MKTYIVRIYRQKANRPNKIVGVVEEVGVKIRKAFTNYDELWGIFDLYASLQNPQSDVSA